MSLPDTAATAAKSAQKLANQMHVSIIGTTHPAHQQQAALQAKRATHASNQGAKGAKVAAHIAKKLAAESYSPFVSIPEPQRQAFLPAAYAGKAADQAAKAANQAALAAKSVARLGSDATLIPGGPKLIT